MARDYATALRALLPTGAFWDAPEGSVKLELIRGVTREFERVDDRLEQLLLEMNPATTTELVADWERVFGLPDPCLAAAPSTIEGRRAAIVSRLIARGGNGPSVPFLTDIAVALGYDASDVIIRRFAYQPADCESACVDALNDEDAGWPYVWEVIAIHGALDDTLECQISHRYALAHLALTFSFPLFYFGDGTFSRAGTGVLTNPETGEQTTLGPDELGTFYLGV